MDNLFVYEIQMMKESIHLHFNGKKTTTLYVKDSEDANWDDFYLNETEDMDKYDIDLISKDPDGIILDDNEYYGKWTIKKKKTVLLTFHPKMTGYPHYEMAKEFDVNKLDAEPMTSIELFCLKFNNDKNHQEDLTIYINSFEDFFIQTNFSDLYNKRIKKELDRYEITSDNLFLSLPSTEDNLKFDTNML